jgi:UDP-N-acetylmuramate dehydrogenase
MFHVLADKFKNYPDIDLRVDSNLEGFSTIKLNKNGNIAIVSDLGALKDLITFCRESSIAYEIVGLGANQILSKDNILYIKIVLSYDSHELKYVQNEYSLPASVSLNKLTAHAIKYNLVGWEVFTGIPATLGGAIAMNAGTRLGEIGEIIKDFTVMLSNGDIDIRVPNENTFSYRKCNDLFPGEIIISATLVHNGIQEGQGQKIKDYLKRRTETQPLWTKNCGCVFKNPAPTLPAGMLIDACGLKGTKISGIEISNLHGNFFENNENASVSDFLNLVKIAKEYVELSFGQKFELEVKI